MVHEFGIDEHVQRMDKNNDGFLDHAEMPANSRALHERVDTNNDGRVHVDEMVEHFVMTEVQ